MKNNKMKEIGEEREGLERKEIKRKKEERKREERRERGGEEEESKLGDRIIQHEAITAMSFCH